MKTFVFTLFVSLIFVSCSITTGKDELKFCQTCTKDDVACEGEETTFKPGQIFVRIQVKNKFKSDSIRLELYEIKNEQEIYIDAKTDPLGEDWDTFCKSITLPYEGKFKVRVYNDEGVEINQGEVEIAE